MSFEWFPEPVLAEELDGFEPAFVGSPLRAHLCDEIGPPGEGFLHEAELVQLLDEGLLGVDMFAMFECGQDHESMLKVGRVDDHGVELFAVPGEGLAVVSFPEGMGKGFGILVQPFAIHIDEAREFDFRMGKQFPAIELSDPSGSDLHDPEITVPVGSGTQRDRGAGRCRETGCCGPEKVAPGGHCPSVEGERQGARRGGGGMSPKGALLLLRQAFPEGYVSCNQSSLVRARWYD